MKNLLRITAALLLSLFGILPAAHAQGYGYPPSLPTPVEAFDQQLATGWNLIGNPLGVAIDVIATLGSPDQPVEGVTDAILSVWKWNNSTGQWTFYSPQLSSTGVSTYAESKGYQVAWQVNSGEGFWVNTRWDVKLPKVVGEGYKYFYPNFSTLGCGWLLLSLPEAISPRDFNQQISRLSLGAPPAAGTSAPNIPINFKSMWMWDAYGKKWIFYAPELEALGGNVGYDYATSRGMYDGTYWTKPAGTGAWVNKSCSSG